MTQNLIVKQQTILLIQNKILLENIDEAIYELQNLITDLTSIDDIITNMQILCNSLIFLNVSSSKIYAILRASSNLLLQHKGIDALFDYWIKFYEQDSEYYPYIIDISMDELAKNAKRVDPNSTLEENIVWFSKYNKKFLFDIFKGLDYKREKLICLIESAYITDNWLYYKIKQRWYAVSIKKNKPVISQEDSYVTLLHHIDSVIDMLNMLNQYNQISLANTIMKIDRYIIINPDIVAIFMQTISFSQLDNGNYWLHFLLSTAWKKRMSGFARLGYNLPLKVFASQNNLQKILLFIKELGHYFQNILVQKQATALQQKYVPQYLNYLRNTKKKVSELRIFIMTSRYTTYTQYASEMLNNSFKKIGCKSVLFREKKYQGLGTNVAFMLKVINNFKPDIILAINNFRPDWLKAYCPEIPFVVWIHDAPETLPRPCNFVAYNDFIFALTKIHIDDWLPKAFPVLKAHKIHLLPMIQNINSDCPIVKNKKYDVGSITNLGVTPNVLSYYEPEKRTGSNDEKLTHLLLKYLEKLEPYEITTILLSTKKMATIIQQSLRKLNLHFTTDIDMDENHPMIKLFKFDIGGVLQKTLPVRHLINNGFDNIFLGGLDWEQFTIFKRYSAGQIPNDKLYSVSSNIAINLNTTPYCSHHIRIGEMLEANSFILSSWKGEADFLPLTEHFTEGDEVVLFKSYKDLIRKVNYFLKKPEERELITKKAKKKFREKFSTELWCKKVLNIILEKECE